MKNKILFLILFSFLFLQKGKSQNCFPEFSDSAKWNVLTCAYGIGVSCNTVSYQYSYDTLFCGHVYSKITPSPMSYSGYIRSDSTRAYIRMTNSCTDKEYLMYDFTINNGDTVYLAYNLWNSWTFDDTTRFILDSSNTQIINGVARDVYYLKYNTSPDLYPNLYDQMIWIKGIGSTTHPFFPLECVDGFFCDIDWRLLCFDSSGVQLYQDSLFNTCDTTYSTVKVNEVLNENQLIIYPVPFTNNLTISIEDALISEIDILNLHGKIIYKIAGIEKNNFNIETLENLHEGIYILKAHTNKGILIKKIIKVL